MQHTSETAVLLTYVEESDTDPRLDHVESTVDDESDIDSGNSSPDSTTFRLTSLSVPDSIAEHHGVCKPQLSQTATNTSPLPARHTCERGNPYVSDLLTSSLAVTNCNEASFVTDVLNRVPTVITQ